MEESPASCLQDALLHQWHHPTMPRFCSITVTSCLTAHCLGRAPSHLCHPVSHHLLPPLPPPVLHQHLCCLLPLIPIPSLLSQKETSLLSLKSTALTTALTPSSALKAETPPGCCSSPRQGSIAMSCLLLLAPKPFCKVTQGDLLAHPGTLHLWGQGCTWGQEGSPAPITPEQPAFSSPGYIHQQFNAGKSLRFLLIALTEKLQLLWCH